MTADLKSRLVAQDGKAWKEMSALVNRCARHGCWKAGASHLQDDVAAEVLILLHTQLLAQLQDGARLDPFLIEVSRRVALSMRRSLDEDRLVSNDAEGGGMIFDVAGDDFTNELEDRITSERAKERIRASVNKNFWKAETHTSRAAPAAPTAAGASADQDDEAARGRSQYGCGDQDFAKQLKAERKKRRWTQRQMATYMGVGLPTYISYEHACVIKPNPLMVDVLNRMLEENETYETA